MSVKLGSKLQKGRVPPSRSSYLVTLKIRRRRTQRNTEIPSGDIISSSTKMVSTMPPQTTKQSKRLKRDTKYDCRPRLYIFTNISQVNKARRTLFAISGERYLENYGDLYASISVSYVAQKARDSFVLF